MIVVLDTNVLIRAAFRRKVDPDNLLALASRGDFEIATSSDLLDELRRLLNADRLQSRYQWQSGEPERFLLEVMRVSHRVEPSIAIEVVRDPADNRVLEAAVEAEADYIVTTDNDLLELNEYEGIRIVTQAEFGFILLSASQ